MLRIVPHTVPRVGRSYENFPDGFELHLLPRCLDLRTTTSQKRAAVPRRARSCSRLIDFVYHSTLGLRVIKRRRKKKLKSRHDVSAFPGWEMVTAAN